MVELSQVEALYDFARRAIEEKDIEVKALQARLDALNKQKDILISELQHKTKNNEELEKSLAGR